MFLLFWEPAAFDAMQALIRAYPGLKARFAYSLETLTIELSDRADTWGESRPSALRLGNVGVLSVLVRVNTDEGVVRIVEVALERRTRPT